MKYEVVVRTNCPAPMHDQFSRTVYAVDIAHAEEQVMKVLLEEYPQCSQDHMWEIVSITSVDTGS